VLVHGLLHLLLALGVACEGVRDDGEHACIDASQFLGLAISPVTLDGGKVEIAFSASDWSAVHAHGQVGPDSLVNTLSLGR
jgi:hypothetical protein